MQVDWITVTAQIINFLILVYLLKRFLYRPVIDAMSRREQRIADRLNDAQTREREAKHEAERYREKTQEIEQLRDELLAKATEEAHAQRLQLLAEARDEVDQVRRQWRQEAEWEKQEFHKAFKQQTAASIAKIARQVLRDLADTELEQQLIRKFLEQLKTLDEQTRKSLTEIEGPIRIATSFTLTDQQRERIRDALNEALSVKKNIRAVQDPEILCGIDLSTEDRKLSWTVDDYLQALEKQIEQALGGVSL